MFLIRLNCARLVLLEYIKVQLQSVSAKGCENLLLGIDC